MSMFPGSNASIIRNEAGEPLGWDYPSYDEGPSDPYDDYDNYSGDMDAAWFCNACGCWGDGVDAFQGKRKIKMTDQLDFSMRPVKAPACPDCGSGDLDY